MSGGGETAELSVLQAAQPETETEETVEATEEQKKVVDESVMAVTAHEEEEEVKKVEMECGAEMHLSFKEESNCVCDLKESEEKALIELREKVKLAILQNKLFEVTRKGEETQVKIEKENEAKPAEALENETSTDLKQKGDEETEGGDQHIETGDEKMEEMKASTEEGGKPQSGEEHTEKSAASVKENHGAEDNGTELSPGEIDMEISLWGVPLLPSRGRESTDVILLKFLRAREFKVREAFEMLRSTLLWRKENQIDTILDEDFGSELNAVAYLNGVDREGHPVCYNVYGVFGDEGLYQKTFGTEEKCEQFLRWRLQMMEHSIQKLKFIPGGVSSILQITDLKNSPGPSKKELRLATKKAVALLQDNYPEFVARNIFINVPFWYYAFNALLSPFLTQRTKSKFVFARPSKVTETLFKYVPAGQVPVQYGGLKREHDSEFTPEDAISEVIVKGGTTENVEIPAPEAGTTFIWDMTVLGWEVNYKEEFVPADEGSYTMIIQKNRKMGAEERTLRHSFRTSEPGKIILSVENCCSFKKKKVIYRYKVKMTGSS